MLLAIMSREESSSSKGKFSKHPPLSGLGLIGFLMVPRLFNKLCQNKTTVLYKTGCQHFVSFEPAFQRTQAGLNLALEFELSRSSTKNAVTATMVQILSSDG